jgi:hypothetical protein
VTRRPEVPEYRIDARAATVAAPQRYVASLNESDPEGDWTMVQIKSQTKEPGFSFSVTSLKRQASRASRTISSPSK